MAQANSFSHIGAVCVRVLARQAAINAVKSELTRQGLRVHSVPMREIHIAADDYLAAHPELIPATEERVRNSTRLRTLLEHEERKARRNVR
jgi:hypothetical protein